MNGIKFDDVKGMIRKLEGLLETVILTALYYLVWKYAYRSEQFFSPYYGRGKYVLMIVYAVLVVVLFFLCEGFQYGHRKLADVLVSQWISLCIVNVVSYLQLSLIANHMIGVLPILLLTAIDFIAAYACCWKFTALYHTYYVPRNMLMIYGHGVKNSMTLKFKVESRPDKYHVTQQMAADAPWEVLVREIDAHDAVIINDVPAQLRNDILKYCYEKEIRAYATPKISDIILKGAPEITLFDTPLFLIRGTGFTPAQRFVKRFFDIVLCLPAMVIAGPIMLIIAAAIKLDDHGPVLYRQKRVTRNGRVFEILKFRSMIVDADKEGTASPATENDPRITRTGGFLRRARLDELPQILNILKGDMSIVGPRPEFEGYYEGYTSEVPEFVYRLKVKAGLTGYAQIYGRYNTSPYDKLRLDLMYIENYSVLLDMKLILMTVQILFKKESAEGFEEKER